MVHGVPPWLSKMIHAELETRLLKCVKGFLDRLPAMDIENAVELVANGECGAGFELLCDQLAEHAIDLNAAEALELEEFALAMDLDISTFGLGS